MYDIEALVSEEFPDFDPDSKLPEVVVEDDPSSPPLEEAHCARDVNADHLDIGETEICVQKLNVVPP
jgi:hypothetical protein